MKVERGGLLCQSSIGALKSPNFLPPRQTIVATYASLTLRSGINVESLISVEANFSSSNWRIYCLKTFLTGHKWAVNEISSKNYGKILKFSVQKWLLRRYSEPQLNNRTSTFISDFRVARLGGIFQVVVSKAIYAEPAEGRQTWRILSDLMDGGVTLALERRKLRLFGVILQSLFHLLQQWWKKPALYCYDEAIQTCMLPV